MVRRLKNVPEPRVNHPYLEQTFKNMQLLTCPFEY